MDRIFVVNAPMVVSEIIDGEVIIMNLKSGNYYSSARTGAVVWAWIEEGLSEGEIHARAAAHYDAGAGQIEAALGAFFDRLVEEGLVRESAASANGHAHHNGADGSDKSPFVKPELCAYTDMQDLLLLDPVHDVDTVGWPTPKPGPLE